MRSELSVAQVRETGSFGHGTGLRGRSDVDLIVALNYARPMSPTTALHWVRDALVDRFPRTTIRTSSPTVVVPFAGGDEVFEVAPGFLSATEPVSRYWIPRPPSGWMETAPAAHLRYVADVNKNPQVGAKALTDWWTILRSTIGPASDPSEAQCQPITCTDRSDRSDGSDPCDVITGGPISVR
ncbi:SMODS domain-containing nucleotidyltransferase [Curtobacterium sp. 24E2]